MTTITDDCDDVLAFLQAVAIKSPWVIAAPLYLCADKRTRVWFRRRTDINLPRPPKPAPQDHIGLTGVMTDVETMLYTAEALCPVVAAHNEADNKTKGWDHLLPMAHRAKLAARATNGT